jgi:hypothetical protein
MSEPEPITRRIYAVRRRALSDKDKPGPAERAFPSRAAAEEFRAGRERSLRAEGDARPLLEDGSFSSVFDLSSFDPPVLLDWLLDADIPAPPPSRWTYQGDRDLWEEWLQALTPGQVAHLYEALDRFTFYEVHEVELIEGAYTPDAWEAWEAGRAGSRPPRPPRRRAGRRPRSARPRGLRRT